MRAAQVNDYWRRIYRRPFQNAVSSIRYEGIRGLGAGRVDLSGGITVFCGPNGSGKSTLLQAIFSTLSARADVVLPEYSKKLSHGRMTLDLVAGGADSRMERNFAEARDAYAPSVPIPAEWLEPAVESPYLLKRFLGMRNLEDLLEPLEPAVASAAECELASYVIGKQYEAISTFEIDGLFDREFVPYFRVTAHGVTYGAETMGLGEFSVLVMLWSLQRVERDSVLLIEEPESFISPRSQECLTNYLAKVSYERGISILLSTHSPAVLSRVPQEHIVVLVRSQADGVLFEPRSEAEYLTPLGLVPKKTALVLVEDHAARVFATTTIWAVAPAFAACADFAKAGSAQDVGKLIRSLPRDVTWVTFLGLLDGDMRERMGELGLTEADPFSYLPGNQSPEDELRDALMSDLDSGSEILGVDKVTLVGLLAGIEGRDVHDWVAALALATGRTSEMLLADLSKIWLNRDENRQAIRELVDAFMEHMEQP